MFLGRLRFVDKQQEFQGLCEEREEAIRVVEKHKEDLYSFQDMLKEAHEMVKGRDHAIFVIENEREHIQAKKDKGLAKLEKAQVALRKVRRHWQPLSRRGTPSK